MAARSTMADLIASLRALIYDASSPYDLTDDEVEDVLDRHSQRVLRHRLAPAWYAADGLVYWFVSNASYWESRTTPYAALTLQDSDETTLSVDESDLAHGIWKLTTGTTDPVYLHDGYTYDLYGAASECCTILMAKLKAEYTFSTTEGSFNRDSRIKTLGTLQDQYSTMKRPYVLSIVE